MRAPFPKPATAIRYSQGQKVSDSEARKGRKRCCATIVMSPLLQNRNVPLIRPRKGGRIGADGDEPGGIAESRSAEPSKERAVASCGCGATAARELPTSEAVVE